MTGQKLLVVKCYIISFAYQQEYIRQCQECIILLAMYIGVVQTSVSGFDVAL